MGRITLQQAAQWCGGKIDPKYSEVTFFGANIDTRKMEKGQLFVALQGARDGHDFIDAAFEKGAAAVLCTHCDGDYPAIVVPDTRIALGLIAKQERIRLGMKVVAITGSVGKTTTKEMVAAVLAESYRTGKTPVNHNNDIGMPMTILGMPEDTEVAVLEMGMNHFREIAYLSEIAKPDVAVIVNIGTMHIEHLGSMEGILQAKLEILEGMEPGGKVILNGDDPLLWNQHKTLSNVTYFGSNNSESKVFGADVCMGNEQIRFCVHHNGAKFSVDLPVEGAHYVADALAAVSVGLELGVTPEKICAALRCFQNADGRQEIFRAGEYTIIKDCYNAGPESMAAALSVLHSKPGRRIAVLGDMLELGTCSQAEHYKVGRLAAEKANVLLAYGPNSPKMLKGALTGGMPNTNARAFENSQKLTDVLTSIVRPGDVLLFKGSRGMRMELILEQFLMNIHATEDKK
ncbi:MAG: UDP-N-acetylmuramoyl-tripeptide--D-alanyl-D-alanine ligase [Oscillospiraceae bacterium]|nr:UDP-N-acetylmuramoyl-tripeptide--D-alanyl-D-alanine ligase [Oscillospiraceae bacterium]